MRTKNRVSSGKSELHVYLETTQDSRKYLSFILVELFKVKNFDALPYFRVL